MVQETWAEILRELNDSNSDARASVDAYRVDPDVFSQHSLSVSEQEGDFGVTFLIAVGGPVAIHVLISMWDDLVRPRLRAKYGVDGGSHVE
ncbi:MAG TPA: hypothetical protein VI111_06495 [Thermoleophilaceae bacterium]